VVQSLDIFETVVINFDRHSNRREVKRVEKKVLGEYQGYKIKRGEKGIKDTMREKIFKIIKNNRKISDMNQEKNEGKNEEKNSEQSQGRGFQKELLQDNILKEFQSLTPNIVQDFIRERFEKFFR
jgi:hypothetical protein